MCLFVSDFSNMKINGSNFCFLLVQLFLMVKSQMSWLTAEEFSKPNFIILVNHDHAVSTLGLRNSTFQKLNPTTNITALAEDGWFFSNAFCSNGSSAPSTATLLTGKFAHQHGLLSNGQKFDPNQPTLLKALTTKGYETALFGRWDLLIEPAEFDHWEVLDNANVFLGGNANGDYWWYGGVDPSFSYQIDIFDFYRLLEIVESGDTESCGYEAGDITGEGYVNIFDVYAMITLLMDGSL